MLDLPQPLSRNIYMYQATYISTYTVTKVRFHAEFKYHASLNFKVKLYANFIVRSATISVKLGEFMLNRWINGAHVMSSHK